MVWALLPIPAVSPNCRRFFGLIPCERACQFVVFCDECRVIDAPSENVEHRIYSVRILFRDKDGRMCGEGTLHNALGTTVMQPGANTIYAEILTDISVLEMNFTLEIERPFAPVEREE